MADYTQNHMDEAVLLSLQGLAKKCGTSDATVLRFCRSLGYLGFADFKISLVPELLRSGKKAYIDVDKNEGKFNVKEVLQKNFQHQMESTLGNLDEDTMKTLAYEISRAGKILLIGLGGSSGVAHIFCDSLGSLGIFSTFLSDRSIIQNVMSTFNRGDMVIGISHSGETQEVVSALKTAKEHGSITVGITNFSPSPLADVSQYVLATGVPTNLLGSYSCQARISQLMILELMLYEISNLISAKNNGQDLQQGV
ncbi:MAG: MurR/RpiR family transcriptional regulator [Candidatus Marinimicrobia bacterium]|nr:MurR/RpiR family transcriptional regulator [Candidatus Neomarinimicrobiota bacterium]